MASIIANTNPELEQVNKLLDKDMPSYRQAYSDRTAWIMACMSELAYIRFNPLWPGMDQKKFFVDQVKKLIDKNRESSLIKLINKIAYDPQKEEEKLKAEASLLRSELVDKYDENGTQAILLAKDKFMILAFRGTETTSIKDIKADVRATTRSCPTGGKIHTGFDEAFEEVSIEIQKKLNEDKFKDLPLLITGHSLGGALATVAAKKLTHRGGIAGCYTFGAPRVGDEEWVSDIKTPMFRLVNAADCVTMLPPGAVSITIFSWLAQFIPYVGKTLKPLLLSKFGGYLHCGNMRYLTNCSKGNYKDVRLLYSVSFIYRLKGLFISTLPWTYLLSDHSISVYRKKLSQIALNRNPL